MNNELITKTRDLMYVPAVTAVTASRPEYSVEPQSGSVLDYWRILYQRKLTLFAFAVVGLIGALAFTLPQTPMYRASAALEIQDNKNDAFAIKILSPVADSTPNDPLADIPTQIRLLQSQTLVERALNQAHISSSGDLNPHSGFIVSRLPKLPFLHGGQSKENLVEMASKKLKVTQSGQTRIVEVSFDASDPALAARFANALTSEFIDENLQARWQMNHRTSDWLVGQLDDMRVKLQSSEDALQTYARQKGLMYTGDKQSVSEDKLRQLQMELSKAQADRVERQSRFEIARSASADTVPEVLNDANLRAMETTLTDLRRQDADLAVTFKPDYTKAKRIRAEITTLESAINEKRAAIVDRLNNELQESRRREELLAAAYTAQTRSVVDDSAKSVQYDMLKHEVDSNRQVYEAMLQRVKESSIVSAMKTTNVRVIDAAKPPLHPYTPNLPLNTAAGLICGLLLGAAVIVVRTRTNLSLQNPGEAEMLLGIPELGVIPAADSGPKRLSPLQTLFSGDKQLQNPGTGYSANAQAVADSFRAVLASILFAEAKQQKRVLVVTSANPGEGKTSTVTNLAATLANMNRKVLLIDGDIRSPRLHSLFNIDNSVGLTNVLREIAFNKMPMTPAIRETSIPNLHVLTSGSAIQADADLLFSPSMAALVDRYREEYDMVLIDTPPMLLMPDARVLGRVADGVVLIARAGRTGRNAIQAAFKRFVEDQTPVLGVILNDWNFKASPYQYFAAYKDSAAGQPTLAVTRTSV